MTITLGTAAQNPIIPDKRIATYDAMANAAAGTIARQWWDSQVQPQIDDVALLPKPIVYGDMGQGALIQYRRTGDPKMAQGCAGILIASLTGGQKDPNWIRAYFMESVCVTYEIWKDITPEQQTAAFTLLKAICDLCTGVMQIPYSGGFRTTDTDQTIGQFGGVMACKLLFPDIAIPLIAAGDGETPYTIGGLDEPAGDTTSVRGAINQMLTKYAVGGEWLVSSGYNFSDDAELIQRMWLWMLRITGVDHFPDAKAWILKWVYSLIGDLCPTLKDRMHWGDDQAPDADTWDLIVSLCVTHQCLIEMGETKLASWVKFLIEELYSLFGDVYPYRWSPEVVAFLDPTAPAIDYRPEFPRTVDCSQGIGQVSRHDGFNATDPFIQVLSPNSFVQVDHQCFFLRTFQIFDGGRWVTRNLEGYGPAKFADVLNSVYLGGTSVMNVAGMIGVQDTDDFLMVACASSGQPGYIGQYNPAPAYVNEYTGVVFYLPKLKAVVVLDRMDLDDPRLWSADRIAGYPTIQKQLAGHSLKEVFWHNPVANPTATPTGATWNLADGSPVRLDCFSTGGPLKVSVDPASAVLADASQANPIEPVWSRVRYGSDRAGFEAIVSVFQWGPAQATPIPLSNGSLIGFRIGSVAIVFSSGASPEVTPDMGWAAAGGDPIATCHVVGTDATGKWSVTTQTAAPVVVPTPAPAPIPPALPALVIGQTYVFPDGTKKVFEMLPGFVEAP